MLALNELDVSRASQPRLDGLARARSTSTFPITDDVSRMRVVITMR